LSRAAQVMIAAGEASGDMHGARLAKSLRELLPGVTLTGVGGPEMAAAGVDLLYRAEELTLMGFSEVPAKLGHILAALGALKRHLKKTRPELLILIDFPDFNFRLGKAAKRLGLKVLYYICPQVWAWRRGRAAKMAAFVDRLAAVFPFESDFLAQAAPDLPVSFVGHPLLDAGQEAPAGAGPLPVPAGAELVGLLPGSRMSELTHILPLLLKAADIMRQRRPGLHFILPLAPGLDRAKVDPFLAGAPPGLTMVPGRAAQVMQEARLLLVASGTATLQAALAGTPMVVVYRTGWFNYAVARALVKVDFIAMPNLIAGRKVVPELIQGQAEPRVVAEQGLALLAEDRARQEMLAGLDEVKKRMGGPGASRRVAELARAMIWEAS